MNGDRDAKQMEAYRFKPGQSGNPKGKPKGAKNRAKMISDMLMAPDPTKVFKTALEAAVASVLTKAMKEGDHKALESLLNRIDGKPHQTQSIEHEVTDNSAILDKVRKMADKKAKEQKKKK